MERTTDLDVIRKHRARFTWGSVQEIHDIGPYTIVEYISRNRDKEDETCFHVYVDGKNTSSSTSTLEGAMILAIAHKHLEVNEARYMAMAACKILGVKE
jgi:hypothetical protein